jgi:hypothetical protein
MVERVQVIEQDLTGWAREDIVKKLADLMPAIHYRWQGQVADQVLSCLNGGAHVTYAVSKDNLGPDYPGHYVGGWASVNEDGRRIWVYAKSAFLFGHRRPPKYKIFETVLGPDFRDAFDLRKRVRASSQKVLKLCKIWGVSWSISRTVKDFALTSPVFGNGKQYRILFRPYWL